MRACTARLGIKWPRGPLWCGNRASDEDERIGATSIAIPGTGDDAGIRACRDRFPGQPQEVQHSAAGTARTGADCPRRGIPCRASGFREDAIGYFYPIASFFALDCIPRDDTIDKHSSGQRNTLQRGHAQDARQLAPDSPRQPIPEAIAAERRAPGPTGMSRHCFFRPGCGSPLHRRIPYYIKKTGQFVISI